MPRIYVLCSIIYITTALFYKGNVNSGNHYNNFSYVLNYRV